MTPIWAWFGYDEPNYTYSPDGRAVAVRDCGAESRPGLCAHAQSADDRRRHARVEVGIDERLHAKTRSGRPIYDWTIVDRIISTYVERGMKPLVEIGFMPEALSSHPDPYRISGSLEAAPSCSPAGAIRRPTTASGDSWSTNGSATRSRSTAETEVESWWWEVWNEPDIGYWHGTPRSTRSCTTTPPTG